MTSDANLGYATTRELLEGLRTRAQAIYSGQPGSHQLALHFQDSLTTMSDEQLDYRTANPPVKRDGGSIGISVAVAGSLSMLECMGLFEAAKIQYLDSKANKEPGFE